MQKRLEKIDNAISRAKTSQKIVRKKVRHTASKSKRKIK